MGRNYDSGAEPGPRGRPAGPRSRLGLHASVATGASPGSWTTAPSHGLGGIPLVARGNDSGYMVPHIPIPPVNTLLPVIIALGGSKVLFGSSKTLIAVEGKGEQCGCCLPPFIPLSQNHACNDPCSYPSDYVIAPNTVEVGMTLGDVIAGLVSAAIETAVSFVMGKAAGAISGQVSGLIARQIAQRSFWEFAGELGVEGARVAVRESAENIAERASIQAVDALIGEAAKVGMEGGVDAIIGRASGDPEANRDSLFDDGGGAVAGLCGECPVADPRVYGADGTEQLTGEGI